MNFQENKRDDRKRNFWPYCDHYPERQGEDFVVTESLSLKDDLDADSVDLMEFILTLEDEFSIEISDEEIDQLQSVGDVVKIIQGK